jgi:hypothetical protein
MPYFMQATLKEIPLKIRNKVIALTACKYSNSVEFKAT